MTPVEIIEQATVEGVILALSPAGTITATGAQSAVDKWLPTIRDNKSSILCELQRERTKMLAMLEAAPGTCDVVIADNPSADPVVIAVVLRMRLSGDASTSPDVCVESVDGVDSRKIDSIDPGRHHALGSAAKCAEPGKTQTHQGFQATSTPANRQTLFNRTEQFALLAKFRLGRMPADVHAHAQAGYAADELRRTVNIAFRLITINKFGFDRAFEAAAQWVVDNPEHPAEAGFVDVMQLYRHRRQGNVAPAESTDDSDDLVAF